MDCKFDFPGAGGNRYVKKRARPLMLNEVNAHRPNSLDAYWMPFTANRAWKKAPVFVAEANGLYYKGWDGKSYLDAIAGLWCVNVGHCHPRIVEAIRHQAGKLDY